MVYLLKTKNNFHQTLEPNAERVFRPFKDIKNTVRSLHAKLNNDLSKPWKNFLLPMNFSNLSFLNPIHLLRCQPSCVNDRHLNSKSFIENSKVLTKDIISPVKLQFVLRRSIWFFHRFFFLQFLLHSYLSLSFFQQKLILFGMQYAYSHCEYNGQAIQANI